MKNIKALIGQLPFELTDEIDDQSYYLHIMRGGTPSEPLWLAYYGTSEDHDTEQPELIGNGETIEEAVQQLAEGIKQYELHKDELRRESAAVGEEAK